MFKKKKIKIKKEKKEKQLSAIPQVFEVRGNGAGNTVNLDNHLHTVFDFIGFDFQNVEIGF